MNVILIQDVKNLGSLGTEIEVKDGYARNFLIPQKMAMEATPAAMRVLEKKKKERAEQEEKIKEEFRQVAEKIAALSCTISVESGEGDKLFGSVTSEDIAEALLAEGVEIDKRKIALDEPIKDLGVYTIEIKLHPEVMAQTKVWVVKK